MRSAPCCPRAHSGCVHSRRCTATSQTHALALPFSARPQNVDYCASQGQQNCHGWLTYNVSAPGFPAELTPQAGFSLYVDSIFSNWDRVQAARSAWHARVVRSLPGGPAAYPQRSVAELAAFLDLQAAVQVAIIDPLEWPNNPSCPFGSRAKPSSETEDA